ncbi:MAG TPA: glycosyltransferase [Chloroflexota bacterium]|nr:glycosyltransferase [Chloroflexota bacterium]
MRVLFTTQPAVGHFHPLVPLAQALVAAGHEVAVACAPAFSPTVAAGGLRPLPAGLDWLEEDNFEHHFPRLAGMPPGPGRVAWIMANVFAGVTAERMVADLLTLAATWPFDLVVRETQEFGGCLAAERLGLPHAVVQVVAPRPRAREILVEPLTRQRAALGLPSDPELETLHRYLQLSTRPPMLQGVAVPPTHHSFRAPIFDQSMGDALPPWAAGPLTPPVVYATLGTVFTRHVAGLFTPMLDGVREVAGTLILTVGSRVDPASLGPQPAHVHVERYVPQSLLFSRCDLVVTHGGSGTLMAALSHGLPLVVIPIGADQPDNAARVADLGLGRVIGRGSGRLRRLAMRCGGTERPSLLRAGTADTDGDRGAAGRGAGRDAPGAAGHRAAANNSSARQALVPSARAGAPCSSGYLRALYRRDPHLFSWWVEEARRKDLTLVDTTGDGLADVLYEALCRVAVARCRCSQLCSMG